MYETIKRSNLVSYTTFFKGESSSCVMTVAFLMRNSGKEETQFVKCIVLIAQKEGSRGEGG